MTHWIRFRHGDSTGFGTLEGNLVHVYRGDLFAAPQPTGDRLALDAVTLLTPCEPGQMICLWNNFHSLAAKMGWTPPDEPLWFLKSPSAFHPHGAPIRRPPSYSGKVIYEGELGIVIGKRTWCVSEAEAADHVFGYTCVNDVTAIDLLRKNPAFEQWARAKSFPTFGVFGPSIATGIDPLALSVRTVLNGAERQNYAVADMFFKPLALVAALSHEVELHPGDIIACGTSIGAGAMKEASNVVEIAIDGVGSLVNRFDQAV